MTEHAVDSVGSLVCDVEKFLDNVSCLLHELALSVASQDTQHQVVHEGLERIALIVLCGEAPYTSCCETRRRLDNPLHVATARGVFASASDSTDALA